MLCLHASHLSARAGVYRGAHVGQSRGEVWAEGAGALAPAQSSLSKPVRHLLAR